MGRLIAKVFASIAAALFVIVTVVVLLLTNAERQLLSPDLYKRALVQQHIYERFPSLVAEQIAGQMTHTAEQGGGPPAQIKQLSQADWEAILSDLVPARWLQIQAETAIDQAFSYLQSDAPAATVKVSLAEVKARVAGEEGVSAALRVVRSWPPCSDEQIAAWAGARLEELPSCRPPEDVITAFAPQVKQLLGTVAAQEIPDELDLTQAFTGGIGAGEALPSDATGLQDDPRLEFKRILLGVRLSPLLPVALLLLITLFGVRSFKGLLRWWGIPLLLAGVLGVGLAFALPSMMNWAIANSGVAEVADFAARGMVQAGLDLGRHVVRAIVNSIAVQAGVITLAGLALLGISGRVAGGPRRGF